MNTDWQTVDQLFHQALEHTHEARAEFLAQHEPALQQEVQALLDAHEENRSFLETPVMRVNLAPQFGRWHAHIAEVLVPTERQSMIGRLLDGKYRLEELIGRGGMGAVYRAQHVGTGRRVAVKVIAPELAGNHEFIERFRREAKTIGRLRHPNIVNVTDFGVINENGGEREQTLAYLVMEYLDGCTLAAKLRDKRPLPLADALDILKQTCAAIDEAHAKGILHRDLKPENIWLEPVAASGHNVKVLDFGIAQLHDALALEEPQPLPFSALSDEDLALQRYSITEDDTLRMNLTLPHLTRSGTVLGTPKYMSPEQCQGETLDRASDIYSLGVIAYQMLSGDVPFHGTVAELLQQHREAAPLPLRTRQPRLPAALDEVVARALAKNPVARPASAGAFAFLLNLQTTGDEWLCEQTDAFNRQHGFKLLELAARLQWPSWLLTGLILLATVALPGLHPWQAGLTFSLLWLLMTANALWQQNRVTAACTLFVEQTLKPTAPEVNLRDIVRAVTKRSFALEQAIWAEVRNLVCKRRAEALLIVPALMNERLNVTDAAQRAAQLSEPLRRKLVYPFFQRWLSVAFVLTVWQVLLVLWGVAVDGRQRFLSDGRPFILLALFWLCTVALSFSLKSSFEQALLYLTARQALGEITPNELPMRQETKASPNRWWLLFKTYAPTAIGLLLVASLQMLKFPLMSDLARTNHVATVKALHASGVPLPFARRQNTRLAGLWRRLDRAGLDFLEYSFTPYNGNHVEAPAMTKFLLEKGFGVNAPLHLDAKPPGILHATGQPLHMAVGVGEIETVRLLIAHGADIHALDSIGRSPLLIAITHNPRAIEPLLAAGVTLAEQTRFGPSLLAAARYQWLYPWAPPVSERENSVRILLGKGADPNTRDGAGRNALMVMSMERRLEDTTRRALRWGRPYQPAEAQTDKALQLIGEALLQAGCDLNAADQEGRTPLMYAVKYNRPTAVRLLLEKGANPMVKDKSGMIALDLAKQANHIEIVKLLLSKTPRAASALDAP